MRAVLFEGTPDEFARVEAAFRAGGDPALLTRSIVLPQIRPQAWPELDEEQCHRLAERVLERAPARLVDALSALAVRQNLIGDLTIEDWSHYAHRLPEELAGLLAELARCASRAFIELCGCERAPERVKGAAEMLVQKVRSEEGAYFVVRPGLMRAMAELDLLDPLPSAPERSADAETGGAPEPRACAHAITIGNPGWTQHRRRAGSFAAARCTRRSTRRAGQGTHPSGEDPRVRRAGHRHRGNAEPIAGAGRDARAQPLLAAGVGRSGVGRFGELRPPCALRSGSDQG